MRFLACLVCSLFLSFVSLLSAGLAAGPIEIGSRLELMVDDYLVEKFDGARLEMHRPTPREVAIVHDEPWEGSGCGYHSVFQDGDLYRMYHKAWHLDFSTGRLSTSAHPLYTCYAESDDGIHWRKPKLGLHEFEGSKDNNIVIVSDQIGEAKPCAGHPAVFKDANPDCPADARYKALLRSRGPRGLLAFKSADGIHWSLLTEKPVITEGAFDSQNLAFWDPVRKEYRAYWRIFTAGVTTEKVWKPTGRRAIRTATSKDFLNWGPHADLTYVDSPPEQLYTNQIAPYARAPHIFIGFPSRYTERGWSPSMEALPELEHRRMRAKASQRYGTAITDGLLMTSRDGKTFKRWGEAFIRPGPRSKDSWKYGDNYQAWGIVETKSSIPGAPNELSVYATEGYWTGKGSQLRRHTLRIDGFVSVNAPLSGGQFVTKPLLFTGKELVMNFSTSAAGSVRVEIQDAVGKPIEGFALDDCPEIFGDSIEQAVAWKGGADVSKLAGKPIRLRFVLSDADLYSFRFK